MLWNCDLASAFEDGGIGAVIMALIWGLWHWYRSRAGAPKKSAYEK